MRDAVDGRTVWRLGSGPAALADSSAELLAWCAVPCAALTLSGRDGDPVRTLAAAPGERFDPGRTWLSPDGAHVAAVVLSAPAGGLGRSLRVLEVATGRTVADDPLLQGAVAGGWRGGGGQFFMVLRRPSAATSALQLRRWRAAGPIQRVDLPVSLGPPVGLVALPVTAAQGLLLPAP